MQLRPSVCLNMIVKDEAHVISRCLNSLKPYIDHWVIVDTGSSDNTPAVIESVMQGVPGTLHHRPWVNFEHNRNEAVALAEGTADYLYIIDADEEFFAEPDFAWPNDGADGYHQLLVCHGTEHCYYRAQLIRNDGNWRYEGVMHEVLIHDAEHSDLKNLEQCRVVTYFDSARNQQNAKDKYGKDAEALELALQSDPDNTRHQFYLAQSYRDAQEPERSIAAYQRRAEMGGWAEEVWFSLYQIGLLHHQLGRDTEAIGALLKAYEYRPIRAESLYQLAFIHRLQGRYNPGLLFAREGVGIPLPDDRLFIDRSVYSWRLKDEYAIAASWVGKYDIAYRTNIEVLESGAVPESEWPRLIGNRDWCLERLKQHPHQ